jgi:Flp pilus assembly CpaE family ATPase
VRLRSNAAHTGARPGTIDCRDGRDDRDPAIGIAKKPKAICPEAASNSVTAAGRRRAFLSAAPGNGCLA